jgi:hypothetical protein
VRGVTRFTYGAPIDEDDVLDIQGIEYPMMPTGMRAMRRLLNMKKNVNPNRTEDDEITEEDLDLMLDIVIGIVRPEHRERLREHIEESVSPALLSEIATAIMRSFSDLDPTQPESSSDGSTPTGPDSTAGAPVAELMPVI